MSPRRTSTVLRLNGGVQITVALEDIGLVFHAEERYSLRYGVGLWRPACSVSPMNVATNSPPPTTSASSRGWMTRQGHRVRHSPDEHAEPANPGRV